MTPERKKRIEDVLSHRQSNLVVVLENVWDPHNISAVMRSSDAVGVQDIYVLNTDIPAHKKYGVSSSASAKKWVTTHDFDTVEACATELRSQGLTICTSHLGTESVSLYDLDLTRPMALVFGNEREGISDEMLTQSDQNFMIPQVGMVRSLNISVACAVSLYEALRQRQLASMYDGRSLGDEQYTELYTRWAENKS